MVHVTLRLLIIIVKVAGPSWLPARPLLNCKFVILIAICNWATCEYLPRTGIAYSVYNRSRTTAWCRWPPGLPLRSCTAVTCEYSSHLKNRSRTTPGCRPGGSSTSCSGCDWFMVHVALRLLIIIVKVSVHWDSLFCLQSVEDYLLV